MVALTQMNRDLITWNLPLPLEKGEGEGEAPEACGWGNRDQIERGLRNAWKLKTLIAISGHTTTNYVKNSMFLGFAEVNASV